MTVQFREKALMAYETMPLKQKDKVSILIKQLDKNHAQRLKSQILKNRDLETWVVKVDKSVRMLFTKNEQGFLIIDIVNYHQ